MFGLLVFWLSYLVMAVPAAAISANQRGLLLGKVYPFDEDKGCAVSGDLVGDGSNAAEIAFNYFAATDRLGTIDGHPNPHAQEQAAGIVGNLLAESGLDPRRVQYGGGPGRGIAQWDVNDRWINLQNFARGNNADPYQLRTQLDYLWFELTGQPPTNGAVGGNESSAFNDLKNQTTVEAATRSFMVNFERPSDDPAINHIDQRIATANQIYNQFRGNSPAAVGGTGAGGSGGCGGSVGDCVGDVTEYCWPLEGRKDEFSAYTSLPCTAGPSGCHHDGTPAFDLIVGPGDATLGRKVYAIHKGVVESVKDNYNGDPHCYSIQLRQTGSQNAADDGWWYWHGHIKEPKVQQGQEVEAGTQLAVVGERVCAKNTVPHLHIDRGSPKGEPGGYDCCRDPGIIDLINRLYEALPDASV